MNVQDFANALMGRFLIVLLILFLLFLLLREVLCWYWKINKRLHELRQINQTLTELRDILIQGNTVDAITAGQVLDMSQTLAAEKVVAAVEDGAEAQAPPKPRPQTGQTAPSFCGVCGGRTVPGANFCGACGTRLRPEG
ncbi:MAG: hypothetical protein LBP30_00580 [Clostridiales Family XIII bacterium]|jgi:hypothetical protein|nr:hypothetical protein [Clostridiales Family XIII bacterium]